ncbi:MAG: hypothetical protein HFJ50_02450 [Clostridia bacterium]|jgi:hypothetical protein|nr:hypothetical protein [Clostridia bacterium]
MTRLLNKYLFDENESKKKIRKYLLIIICIIYGGICIAWVLTHFPGIVGDQGHVCDLAQTFFNGDLEEYFPKASYAGVPMRRYMEAYHQQIPLSAIFSVHFKLIHMPFRESLRVYNVISILLISLCLYKITNELSKKYEINKVRFFFLIFTFLSLPMLSTFVYGDLPSLLLCLVAVYLVMRYVETKKLKYIMIASISTMFAYMMRMNSLIYIIAILIYLGLNIFKNRKENKLKQNLIEIAILLGFILITVMPAKLITNYFLEKYDMDKENSYPNVSYFLMAMEEGPRYNGWYSEEIGEYALKNTKQAKEEYPERIKERLKYFLENLDYAFEFYSNKIASMWTENTYGAVWINKYDDVMNEKLVPVLSFYQKAWILLTCICILVMLVQNRKNLSLELLLLLTIFVGGFAFHILWEAKSRYIIPYIIILVPLASIEIKNLKIGGKVL